MDRQVMAIAHTTLQLASDKIYQLLASSLTTNTGRHDIAESGVKHNNSKYIVVVHWSTTTQFLF